MPDAALLPRKDSLGLLLETTFLLAITNSLCQGVDVPRKEEDYGSEDSDAVLYTELDYPHLMLRNTVLDSSTEGSPEEKAEPEPITTATVHHHKRQAAILSYSTWQLKDIAINLEKLVQEDQQLDGPQHVRGEKDNIVTVGFGSVNIHSCPSLLSRLS